jgi:hypothetical protein
MSRLVKESQLLVQGNQDAGFDVPILLIVFNRPHTTQEVIERLRVSAPRLLFVFADGPRKGVADDLVQCQAVRAIIGRIDWPCTVRRLYLDENLGCVRSVLSAVTWFFRKVDGGIILEDDCVPSKSFLPFCRSLLERYADDESVFHISGWSPHQGGFQASYHFDRYMYCWGWASWARAWKQFRFAYEEIDEFLKRGQLNELFDTQTAEYLGGRLSWPHRHSETWDIRWLYSILHRGGYCITPRVNLVHNIGCPVDSPAYQYGASEIDTQAMTHPDCYDCFTWARGF